MAGCLGGDSYVCLDGVGVANDEMVGLVTRGGVVVRQGRSGSCWIGWDWSGCGSDWFEKRLVQVGCHGRGGPGPVGLGLFGPGGIGLGG